MSGEQRLVLNAAHSHLYRGTQLTAVLTAIPDPLRACPVRLRFGDDVEVLAELVKGAGGELALEVPAYQTSAGHLIPPTLWPVAEFQGDEATPRLTLKLGQRLK